MQQLQSSSGALLNEQVLSEVADAREALEKADAVYNAALDKLEVRVYALCPLQQQLPGGEASLPAVLLGKDSARSMQRIRAMQRIIIVGGTGSCASKSSTSHAFVPVSVSCCVLQG
jgi:hypothetical protein